jgi:hypothetical protein
MTPQAAATGRRFTARTGSRRPAIWEAPGVEHEEDFQRFYGAAFGRIAGQLFVVTGDLQAGGAAPAGPRTSRAGRLGGGAGAGGGAAGPAADLAQGDRPAVRGAPLQAGTPASNARAGIRLARAGLVAHAPDPPRGA